MGRRGGDGLTPSRSSWLAAQSVAQLAELAAALPVPEASARGVLRALAEGVGRTAAAQLEPERLAAMRTRVESRPPSAFVDYARDAAAAFGDADAARPVHRALSAMIEGIKILDDIQDDEPACLATEIGAGAATSVALAAIAWGLELTAALPVAGDAWRAAARAIGRGVRETATGQILETTPGASYWEIVDRKTPPLVATALELGALAAGASPAQAAALTQLAIPLGRFLQISDDCNDALGPYASDWRTPRLNLLMLYSLSGPRGDEFSSLLQPETLRAAQLQLLRDGALAYAIHAQETTLATIDATLRTLELPNPEPFTQSLWSAATQVAALKAHSRGPERPRVVLVLTSPRTPDLSPRTAATALRAAERRGRGAPAGDRRSRR